MAVIPFVIIVCFIAYLVEWRFEISHFIKIVSVFTVGSSGIVYMSYLRQSLWMDDPEAPKMVHITPWITSLLFGISFYIILFIPYFWTYGTFCLLLAYVLAPPIIASLVFFYMSRKFPIFQYEFDEYPVAYPIQGRTPSRKSLFPSGHCSNCGSTMSGEICPKCGSVQKGGGH